ncbi:hypothetical protein AVEN_121155-1 [Araneus ventricosus]|uniref:Uncharacterized protein n=1 Tax=Araneus ventricosus TaxID=182803 RepID=A0A4Y2DZM2_ARAVE|nr:hypothetical protein AVEN_121155-1 [Araneus ventricosus]
MEARHSWCGATRRILNHFRIPPFYSPTTTKETLNRVASSRQVEERREAGQYSNRSGHCRSMNAEIMRGVGTFVCVELWAYCVLWRDAQQDNFSDRYGMVPNVPIKLGIHEKSRLFHLAQRTFPSPTTNSS